MNAPPSLWFTPPTAFVPLDLRADARHRVEQLVRRTPALPGTQRLHLAAVIETQVEALRRNGIGFAATCAVRTEERRLSTALLTVGLREIDCGNGFVLDALARHLHRRSALVDLPLGRALQITEESTVVTHASVIGPAPRREHLVHHAHLLLPHPDRRHLITISIATECGADLHRYQDVLDTIGRSLTLGPPTTGGRIAAALDATEPPR